MCGQTVVAKLGPGAVVVVVVVLLVVVVVDEVVDDVVDVVEVVVDVVGGEVVVDTLGLVGERLHDADTTTAVRASISSRWVLWIDSNRRSNEPGIMTSTL